MLLSRQHERFDDQNRFGLAALGLLSLLLRWEWMLEHFGQAEHPASPPAADDDPVLLAVLGAVACARRLRRAVHDTAATTAGVGEPAASEPGVDSPRPRSLLA